MQVVMFNGHKMVVVVLCVLSFVNTFFMLLSRSQFVLDCCMLLSECYRSVCCIAF